MNQIKQLRAMQQITDMKFSVEQAAFQKLAQEETRLRAELARLADMLKVSRSDALEPSEMRAIGADVIWQGWIGRNRAALNMKLAKVLAQKEQRLGALRTAFGKTHVVQVLIEQNQKKEQTDSNQSQLNTAIEQSLS